MVTRRRQDRLHERAKRNDEIYIVNADGSGERPLTHGGGEAAAWLPDGTKISFETCSSCADGHGRVDFYVVNADGSRKTRLMHTSADDLAWQPAPRSPLSSALTRRR